MALRWSKVRENDGDGASGEGPGLRGDQRFVIRSGVYFLPASAAHPPSPPHRWDQYSVSTECPEERRVSQSALTELKAKAENLSSRGQPLRNEADVDAGQSASKKRSADNLVWAAEIVIQ